MRRPTPQADWSEDWRALYHYDLLEVFGSTADRVLTGMFKSRFRAITDLIEERVLPGATVLDVGAAQGNFTLHLAERGYRVTWNDIIGEREGYVALKYESGSVTYAAGNIQDLQLAEPVDAAVLTEVIEHVAHPDQFLASVARLVKPGGWIFLSTPNGQYFRNWLPRFSEWEDFAALEQRQFQPDGDGHIFALWPDELRTISAAAGLVVRDLRFCSNPIISGSRPLSVIRNRAPLPALLALDRVTRRVPWINARFHFCLIAALQVVKHD